MDESTMVMRVESAMYRSQKEKFLENFCKRNSRWRGAHVADILSELYSVDANLEVTGPICEQVYHEWPGMVSICALALYYSTGFPPTRESVAYLVQKASMPRPPYPEFCHHWAKCSGRSYCPRDIACCD